MLPTIVLDPDNRILPDRISIQNIENEQSGIRFSEYFGEDSPLIKINGIYFYDKMIINLEMGIDKPIPYIRLSIDNTDGLFNNNYPTDGDVVTVYLKSRHEDFKSILMNFRITNIDAPVSMDDRGYSSDISIRGVMDVKELYANVYSSYEGNTYDVLYEICKNLGIGYATNSNSFDDAMVHISPFIDYRQLIKNVVSSSYKSENSFFTYFIDQYYNLNLIDVEAVVSNPMQPPSIEYLESIKTDYKSGDDGSKFDGKLALSNSKIFFGTPFHISGYSLFNNSRNSMVGGYRRYVSYRNEDNKVVEEYFIDPIFNDSDKIVTRGRYDESVDDSIKYVSKGYQFNDNVHGNYYYAVEHNAINNSEIRKMGMTVDLRGINPYVHRGMGINVYLYDKDNQGDTSDEVLNKFKSGYYYIDGMIYIYDRSTGVYNTRLKLIKREWDL